MGKGKTKTLLIGCFCSGTEIKPFTLSWKEFFLSFLFFSFSNLPLLFFSFSLSYYHSFAFFHTLSSLFYCLFSFLCSLQPLCLELNWLLLLIMRMHSSVNFPYLLVNVCVCVRGYMLLCICLCPTDKKKSALNGSKINT